MKSNFRIFGVTIFVTIYCFALSVTGNSAITLNNEKLPERALSSVVDANDLFWHTTPSENLVNFSPSSSFPEVENLGDAHIFLTKEVVDLEGAIFRQYNKVSVNFLVNHRKKDLIYPSHYFW